jgi:hypothetical protein
MGTDGAGIGGKGADRRSAKGDMGEMIDSLP